jgi:hypothetical protein
MVCCPEMFILIIILKHKIIDPLPNAFQWQENTYLELGHDARKNLVFILEL